MNKKESFLIEGLGGQKTLRGTVEVNGAKNAALKAMAAAVLFDGPVKLENVPDTEDIHTMAKVLEKLGASVKFEKDHTFIVHVDASTISHTSIDAALAKAMRASVVLTGPLLARYGKLSFPAPGGCVIGARPIDLFVSGYEKMGAKSSEKDCVYDIQAKGGLRGAEISFNKISVGATETLMMAAVLAKGTTVLENCAREPEIANVAEWLNACGASISGVGTSKITIQGTDGKLLKAKRSYVAIPDRIEAGSYLFLGALCAKELEIKNCRPDHLQEAISFLKQSGVPIEVGADSISIKRNSMANFEFKAMNVRTSEYPGFPTDLQAQAVTFLTQASGECTVHESIFEGRFKYVADLVKMGADIKVNGPRDVTVKGPSPLHELPDAEELGAHDIRAGFAIVMAALVAKGKFKVNNVHLIDRGYEKLEEKLTKLGASIKRVQK